MNELLSFMHDECDLDLVNKTRKEINGKQKEKIEERIDKKEFSIGLFKQKYKIRCTLCGTEFLYQDDIDSVLPPNFVDIVNIRKDSLGVIDYYQNVGIIFKKNYDELFSRKIIEFDIQDNMNNSNVQSMLNVLHLPISKLNIHSGSTDQLPVIRQVTNLEFLKIKLLCKCCNHHDFLYVLYTKTGQVGVKSKKVQLIEIEELVPGKVLSDGTISTGFIKHENDVYIFFLLYQTREKSFYLVLKNKIYDMIKHYDNNCMNEINDINNKMKHFFNNFSFYHFQRFYFNSDKPELRKIMVIDRNVGFQDVEILIDGRYLNFGRRGFINNSDFIEYIKFFQ